MPSLTTHHDLGEVDQQRLDALINSMIDGVIAIDKNSNVVLYNAAALNLIDINGNIKNKPLGTALKLYDKDNQEIDMISFINNAKSSTSSRDYMVHYVDGSAINVYISIAPVRSSYGQTSEQGFVLVLRDITREKSIENEREEFMRIVSHELRTPIAISEGNISNAQYIVEKTANINQIQTALQEAHDQVIFLSEMINELTILSKVDRNELTLDVAPIDVRKLIQNLLDEYKPQVKSKDLHLREEIASQIQTLHSSESYIREILQNFITNSIKFTEKGHITVGAKPAKDGIEFWVSDTGVGINKPDQGKIFIKFFRSDDLRTRSKKGMGLGLYIVKKLAQQIKATVGLSSEPNKGTTFSLIVPNQT